RGARYPDLPIKEQLLGAVRQRDRIEHGLVVIRIYDGRWGVGGGRRRLAVHYGIIEDGCGGLAHVQSRNKERRLETRRLARSPWLARFVCAQPNPDNVFGLGTRRCERIERSENAFIIAAKDDPVCNVGMGSDDGTGGILSGHGFAGVWYSKDLRVRHTCSFDGCLFVVGTIIADREGLHLNRQNTHLLRRVLEPAAVGK